MTFSFDKTWTVLIFLMLSPHSPPYMYRSFLYDFCNWIFYPDVPERPAVFENISGAFLFSSVPFQTEFQIPDWLLLRSWNMYHHISYCSPPFYSAWMFFICLHHSGMSEFLPWSEIINLIDFIYSFFCTDSVCRCAAAEKHGWSFPDFCILLCHWYLLHLAGCREEAALPAAVESL